MSTHSLLDFGENQRPMEAIGRSNSSNSLTGESSSASRVKVNGMFVGGVRGMNQNIIKMERSEHERAKYPDRINLDRKGLHSVPILADEPDLRLISLQHNSIKRIQHLDTTFRLVFLDLYHNRLEQVRTFFFALGILRRSSLGAVSATFPKVSKTSNLLFFAFFAIFGLF